METVMSVLLLLSVLGLALVIWVGVTFVKRRKETQDTQTAKSGGGGGPDPVR